MRLEQKPEIETNLSRLHLIAKPSKCLKFAEYILLMLFSAITPTPKSRDLATSSTTIETRSESKCKDTPWAV